MKKLYLGINDTFSGNLGNDFLEWHSLNKFWIPGRNSLTGSSHLNSAQVALMKKLLNLTDWPKPGELLVYDIKSETGYIVHHSSISCEGGLIS